MKTNCVVIPLNLSAKRSRPKCAALGRTFSMERKSFRDLLPVMGKSIRIDSHCRIVMNNFDSVSQLQRFSYVHHCAASSRNWDTVFYLNYIYAFDALVLRYITRTGLYHDKISCSLVVFIRVIILAWCLRLCVGFLLAMNRIGLFSFCRIARHYTYYRRL